MEKVRRAKYLFFVIDEWPFLDIGELLTGRIDPRAVKQLYAISLLKGEQYAIRLEELRALFSLSNDDWITMEEAAQQCGLDLDTLHRFVDQGLLISDGCDETTARLRLSEERLSADQWNAYAALYHFMTKWSDINVDARFLTDPTDWEDYNSRIDDVYRRFVQQHGMPPSEFVATSDPSQAIPLPVVRRDDGLFGVLARRRTTRAFDRESALTTENLSLILYYVFGCHGTTEVFPGLIALKKTSPSGGSLHPTEVYVLVLNVAGIDPGVYHYNVREHAIELMTGLERGEAEEWANEFTAGQSYPRNAQALFLMTSRFYRNFWKYRKHPKAYAVALMDAAHLSQTFYLVSTELGLGAFVTAAINAVNIEQKLGLDGFSEGAVLVCGCGAPATTNFIDPHFRPYSPGTSPLT